jgi:hypothetical protein
MMEDTTCIMIISVDSPINWLLQETHVTVCLYNQPMEEHTSEMYLWDRKEI